VSDSKALALAPRSVDEALTLAEQLAKSALLPVAMRSKPADVLLTIMTGQDLGLTPTAALRAIHIIEGRPVLSADGMIAIVLGSGKAKYFTRVEESDKAVTYETCRIGTDKARRCTWTIEQAKAAGLHLKDNWRGHPRAMLAARAKSELARDVYPDVLMGCYAEGEIGGTPGSVRPDLRSDAPANPPPADVIDAELVTEPAELARIAEATTPDDLKALAPALAGIAEEWKQVAKDRYAERMKALRAGEKAA
jgi:hypothetical protein